MQNELIVEEFILCQFIEPVKKSIKKCEHGKVKARCKDCGGEKCSNTPSKNSIMVKAKELFYDGTFLDRLDQKNNINPATVGECPMDCGGYFIIKGSEKTVIGF